MSEGVPSACTGWTWRRSALAALLICVLGAWAWAPGLSGPYHFDDFVTPLNDPASQSFDAWLEHLPVTLRPATKLSYALEAKAGWAREPMPRRLVSLVMHLGSALLLYALIARLVPMSSPLLSPLLAALLAGLWFLHPVHADSLLLLSGRTAALSGLLLLAALLALERARAGWAGLLFMLACFARETALAGLLPLLVLAASRPGASLRSTLRELAPVLLGALLICVWVMNTPRYLDLAEYSLLGRPFWQSLASQVGAVPVGLGLLFDPKALSIDYGLLLPAYPGESMFVLGVLLYVAAAAGIALCWKRSRAATIGLALWLAALLPTQSIVPKLDALTNRPLSLALAALLLTAAPVLAGIISRTRSAGPDPILRGSLEKRMTPLRPGAVVFAVGLLALLASASAQRSALFRSELALWQDAAAKSQHNARPHLQYAALLKQSGRDREAFAAVLAAQSIDPFSSQIALFVRSYRPSEEIP